MKNRRLFFKRFTFLLLISFASLLISACKPNLGKLKDEGDVTGLLNALESNNDDIRGTSAWYLGLLGDGEAIRPLIIRVLDDDSAQVKNNARNALTKINDDQILIPLLADIRYDVADYASYLLSQSATFKNIDGDQLNSILKGHTDRARLIAPLLALIGDERAFEPLIELLKDENSSTRKEAIIALGNTGDARAADLLVEMLDDEEDSVSLTAANTLLKIIDEISAEQLIAMLNSPNAYTRQYTAELLGYLGDSKALEPLKKARDKESYAMKEVYTESINKIGAAMDLALESLFTVFNKGNELFDPNNLLYSPTKELDEVIDAMEPVLSGQGCPEAGIYDGNGDSTQKLVVLWNNGEPHQMNDYLNYDLLPKTVNETELVVVVEERRMILGEQNYRMIMPGGISGNLTTIQRIRNETDISVREALSGEILLKRTYKGSEPRDFPDSLGEDIKVIIGSQVGFNELWEKFFCDEGFESLPCPKNWELAEDQDVIGLDISPDGEMMAIAHPHVEIRSLINGEVITTLGEVYWQDGVAFSPDGQTLATVDRSGVVRFFRVSDWELLNTIDLRDNSEANATKIAFSPDGQLLAIAPIWTNGRDYLYILRVADGEIVSSSGDINFFVRESVSMAFTPDGQHLAFGMANGEVVIWNFETEYLTPYAFLLHEGFPVRFITFSPDGQYLALVDDYGYVEIVRISDGALIYRRFHEIYESNGAGCVTFLPDGRIMVLASNSNSIYQWEIQEFLIN